MGSTDRCSHPDAPQERQEHLRFEGLAQVVVERIGRGILRVVGRDQGTYENDRNGGGAGQLAEPFGDLGPVLPGHHHVQQDRVGTEGVQLRLQALPAGGREDQVAVGHQPARQDHDDIGFVIDHQDLFGQGCPAWVRNTLPPYRRLRQL